MDAAQLYNLDIAVASAEIVSTGHAHVGVSARRCGPSVTGNRIAERPAFRCAERRKTGAGATSRITTPPDR